MYVLKLLFQKLEIRPISWDTAKDYPLGTSGGIQVFVFQGETDDHPPLGTATCPGQECCSFFHLILPEFQSPHGTLFIPLQKVWPGKKERWSVRV